MITTVTPLIKTENSELIKGPTGKLEVTLESAKSVERNAIGVICHPHPLFGGTMHNKVVTTLAKTFQFLGLSTVRFNFRGVGRSEGEFAHGHGELEDLLAVVEWIQQQHPSREIWLGGFSFGAYIAAKAAIQIEAKKLVTIAPPVQHFPMHMLPPILCSWVLVQGGQDDVVPAEEVLAWAEAREPKPVIIQFPEAGHFFHGQLGELRVRLEEALLSG
jgi:alpha/beta superfamily hydrolase